MSEELVIIREPLQTIIVTAPGQTLDLTEAVSTLTVAAPGPQGASGVQGTTGDTGPQGPQGPIGVPGAGFNYTHTQALPLIAWTVSHNLGGFPNVTITDTDGIVVGAEVQYVDVNILVITFALPFAGKAYLS